MFELYPLDEESESASNALENVQATPSESNDQSTQETE